MSDELLYNSQIFNIYLKLVRQKYSFVDPRELLKQADIPPCQVADANAWFSQQQFDRFYQTLSTATGNPRIGREAGRFAAAPESSCFIRQRILGFTSPLTALVHLGRYMAHLARACTFECRPLGPGQVEVIVRPRPGVRENLGQCLFRQGLFETIVTLFNLDMPRLDHPECLHHSQACCRYLVGWRVSFRQRLQTARNLSGLAALTVPTMTWFFNPQIAWQAMLPISSGIFLGLSLLVEHLQKRHLSRSLRHWQTTSEEMAERIEKSNNNTLLGNEIAHLIGSPTSIEGILQSVAQSFEKRLEFDRGLILLADEEKTRLHFRAGFGLPSRVRMLLHSALFPLGNLPAQDIFAMAFAQRRSFVVNDIDVPPQELPAYSMNLVRKTGCRAMICCPILCDGKALGILAVGHARSRRPLSQNDLNLLGGLANVIGVSIRNAQLLTARKRQFNSTLHVLAATIDARDPLTAGHSEKVTEYSLGICRELGLSEDLCEMIRVAALLHDYGKIAVPDAILKKSGRLTVEEYEIVKTHAQQTQNILKQINFEGIYKQVPIIAGAHHEKIDGSGYPRGLRGADIPQGAKIIAVADFFEAITAKRHYRAPIPLNLAYKMLQQKACTHFDGKIVKAFLNYYKKAYPDDYDRMVRQAPAINRRVVRVPCRTPVVFENGGQAVFGTSTDISTGGIFVASTAAIAEGAPLKLSFSLPDRPGNMIETRGRVVWINQKALPLKLSSPSGFGVEFVGLQQQAMDAVYDFVRAIPDSVQT